jgi:hypothetical protein
MSKNSPKSDLPSAWKLWRAAWNDFRNDWMSYAKILAVVAIPINYLGLFSSIATDASMNAYTSIASITMNVALIWAIVRADKTGEVPKVSSSYYDGSVAIVRFLLVTILLVLMLLPAAFAAAIYLASMSAINTSSSLPEQLLIGTVCVLIALPSFWLIIRYGLAPIATIDTGLPPIAALRYARNLTLGRFWRTLARYALLAIFLLVLAIPIAIVTAVLSFLKLGPVPTIFFQLATTFTALPLGNIYLLKLMHALAEKPKVVIIDGSE